MLLPVVVEDSGEIVKVEPERVTKEGPEKVIATASLSISFVAGRT
jgi:hypothetical protein